ncbi:MAG: response regulator transcription factor [Deltaproteobacteria bacterium]|nr:response regulator transcription factor [Deltaproteobacteria bacterium]
MQIWNDGALEARVGLAEVIRTDDGSLDSPGAIAILGADPLARRALAAALGFVGLADEVTRGSAGAGAPGVDVVVYDDGATPSAGVLRAPSERDARWLALVSSGARARAALSGGFMGALGRDATPEVLAAAIAGLRQGLVTIDPRFSGDVLPTPAPLVAPLALTPREGQVLELLAEGLSNKEIGAQLGVSPHTAKFHVTALLDKLGAETRTEAVVLAARAGLLDL